MVGVGEGVGVEVGVGVGVAVGLGVAVGWGVSVGLGVGATVRSTSETQADKTNNIAAKTKSPPQSFTGRDRGRGSPFNIYYIRTKIGQQSLARYYLATVVRTQLPDAVMLGFQI
ncbi:MAG: hypothetical protein O2913_07975 [Chloroflexi bacterium]|nr:hypothetical protein [Chloroflexota bacterium]